MEPVSLTVLSEARIPTSPGEFTLVLYANDLDDKQHMAWVMGDVCGQEDLLVRVHSECFTGEVMGSQRCDCGQQLAAAMQLVSDAGRGVIVYLRQEGRGIGLCDKLKAYNLQDEGYDTVDANLALGHQADERNYEVAAAILNDLGVRSIRLLSNNPQKFEELQQYGIKIHQRIPLLSEANPESQAYLYAKMSRLHHWLSVSPPTNGNSLHSTNHQGPLEPHAKGHP
jgi:GTP cyclohydrolase II